MGNLTKHVMINKWDDDINNAIVAVGGKTYGSGGLPDYADIIRSQLIANTAIGEGIYQDFLYVDEDNQMSPYPWDGAPTESTNAIQSQAVAKSISMLYDTMALTERFQVLLVDEFPTTEVNLSAVYLVRKKCECGDENCTCTCGENTYCGCYYVKTGKKIRKVDIPDFEFDLNSLFFLTRAEYDAGLSDYVRAIEDMLRKKFGKYWDDEGFALDKVIDQVIADMQAELKAKTDEVIAQVNQTVSDTLTEMTNRLDEAKEELKDSFDQLQSEVGTTLAGMQQNIDEFGQQVQDLDAKVDELDNTIREISAEVDTKFETLEENLDQQLQEFQDNVTTNLNEKFDTLQSSVDETVEKLTSDMGALEDRVEKFEEDTNKAFEDLTTSVDDRFTEINTQLGEFQESIESDLDKRFNTLQESVDKSVEDLTNTVNDLGERIEKFEEDTNKAFEELSTSVDNKFKELGEGLDTQFENLTEEVNIKIDNIDDKVDALDGRFEDHKVEADLKYLSKSNTISNEQLNELK